MLKVLLIIGIALFLIAVGPFLTIWALNTLFPVLAIGYTFDTWAAIVLLGVFLRSNLEFKK